MKKIIFSIGLVVLAIFADAQQIVLWNSTTGKTDITIGSPYNFKHPRNTDSLVADAGLVVDTALIGGIYTIQASGTASVSKYFVGGFGMGSYDSTGKMGIPWGITAKTLSTYYLNIGFRATSPGAIVTIILNSKDSIKNSLYENQGYTVYLSDGTTSGNNFELFQIPLSDFSNCIGLNGFPDGASYMTSQFADSIHQIQFSVNVGNSSLDGSGTATFEISDIYLSDDKVSGITSITQQKAANISSTKLYPNPASEDVKATVSLQQTADLIMIVSDMMGKQIKTQSFGTVSSISEVFVFNASNLAKGMYTVTYVLDGIPAKTDLVAVQ